MTERKTGKVYQDREGDYWRTGPRKTVHRVNSRGHRLNGRAQSRAEMEKRYGPFVQHAGTDAIEESADVLAKSWRVFDIRYR